MASLLAAVVPLRPWPRLQLHQLQLPPMRRLSDMLRPHLLDLLAAAAGLLGAVAIGLPLFGPYASGDAAWLHGVFLGFVALMLLGTVRFLVRTMDFPDSEMPPERGTARPNGRGRPDEPGTAEE